MATVYLARAEGMGGFEREVAVKLIHAHLRENHELTLALLDEARIAAKIRHPNVVQVYDVGEDPSGIFLVMEYVEGDALSGLQRSAQLGGRRIPAAIGLRILADALAGLQGAHEQRDSNGLPLEIVHRDFSPQNILVGTDGVSRLTDFGIAKAAGRSGHTSPGSIKGKVAYMAPEQARGKSVDRRCDVWAAGVIAWELLAGHALHDSEDDVAVLLDVVTKAPPDLRSVDPSIPDGLADAVASALVVDREERCPSADILRSRLIDATRSLGGLADNAAVAAFIAELGGARARTPLPLDSPPSARPRRGRSSSSSTPVLSTPATAAVPRDQETMTLPSLPLALSETPGSPAGFERSVIASSSQPPGHPKGRRVPARRTLGTFALAVAGAAGAMILIGSPPHHAPPALGGPAIGATETTPPAIVPAPPPLVTAAGVVPPAPSTMPRSATPRAAAPHHRHNHARQLRGGSLRAGHLPSIAASAASASAASLPANPHSLSASAGHGRAPPPLAGNPYAD